MPTLGDIARYQAEIRPDATAFVFEGRRTSFAEFDRHTNQVARALLAGGARLGDRIAYPRQEQRPLFRAAVGAAKAGVVMVPVSWRLAGPEIAYIVGDTEAAILFVGRNSAPRRRPSPRPCRPCTQLSPWKAASPAGPPIEPGATPRMTAILPVRSRPMQWAVQLYTSARPGGPRAPCCATPICSDCAARNRSPNTDWNRWSATDVSLVAMPVSHIGGTGLGAHGAL